MRPVPKDLAELAACYAYPAGGAVRLRANMITSLDGAATVAGRSGGLGGPADHRIFHLLRGLADVVIAGAGTVRAEGYGPVRTEPGWAPLRAGRPGVPPIAVVSRSLDLDPDAALFTEAEAPTIVITTADSPADRRRALAARAEVVVAGEHSVDFAVAVAALAERGHRRLHAEGGPTVLAAMVAAGVLDELCLTLSPVLVAGAAARALHGALLPEPHRYELAGALTEDDFLFLHYTTRRRSSQEPIRRA